MVADSTYLTEPMARSMTAHLITVLSPFSQSCYSPPVTTPCMLAPSATQTDGGVAAVLPDWVPE